MKTDKQLHQDYIGKIIPRCIKGEADKKHFLRMSMVLDEDIGILASYKELPILTMEDIMQESERNKYAINTGDVHDFYSRYIQFGFLDKY